MSRSRPAPALLRSALCALAFALVLVTPGTVGAAGDATTLAPGAHIVLGAVFPLRGDTAPLAAEQLTGIRIAVGLVNAEGGVAGHPVDVAVRDLERPADARETVAGLRRAGAVLIIGSYASDLSVAVSRAAVKEGLVYWEAGAVADRLTGRRLPGVYRVGASGTNLGSNSARFVVDELAPRLGIPGADLRVALVAADDDYARSVADAVEATAETTGLTHLRRYDYSLLRPDFEGVVAKLRAYRPDVIVLASHIDDGVGFRRAMLAAGLTVGAFIGSTMAQCGPTWGSVLGPDAIGTFASDRPTGGFDPDVLDPDARSLYDELAAAWATDYPGRQPSEDGLSGFSAAWALLHHVLPVAVASGSLDRDGIIAAAAGVDLPEGSLPDGAGLRFSTDPATLGQNDRAAAVIWQWQAIEQSVTVWPAAYATGTIGFVPLPR